VAFFIKDVRYTAKFNSVKWQPDCKLATQVVPNGNVLCLGPLKLTRQGNR